MEKERGREKRGEPDSLIVISVCLLTNHQTIGEILFVGCGILHYGFVCFMR